MNDLNSVLIEGIVKSLNPIEDGEFVFTIASKRRDAKIELTIVTKGKLAQTCAGYLTVGRGVRVVSWINAVEGVSPTLHIVAEHVEFKQVEKKEKE